MITPAATERVLNLIDEALRTGAAVVAGGTVDGPVVRPTVITGVSSHSPLVCEEVFGPVVCVVPVDGVDDAIRQINAVPYGLNVSIFTRDINKAMAFGRRAEAGQAIINDSPNFRTENMPYGGVKNSGQGTEGVGYAVAGFTRQKLVVINS